jgi:tetratricopeptide (TPR) repeat protein
MDASSHSATQPPIGKTAPAIFLAAGIPAQYHFRHANLLNLGGPAMSFRINVASAYLAACVLMIPIGRVSALDGDSWVGKRVMTKKPGINLRVTDDRDRVVTVGTLIHGDYFVQKESGPWIQVVESGVEGWFSKEDAVFVEDAPEYFTQQIRANREDERAWAMRGAAWRLKGEPDKAIKDLNEAIRLNPKGSAWYASRGTAFWLKKEYDRAMADCNESIRINPSAYGYTGRALVYAAKKEYDKAIKDLNEAIRLNPKSFTAFYNRACCFALLGRTGQAVDDLGRSLELGNRNFEHMEKDNDLDTIRSDPRYQELIKKYAK